MASGRRAVKVIFKEDPIKIGNIRVATQEMYELSRFWNGELVKIWPVWSKDYNYQDTILSMLM